MIAWVDVETTGLDPAVCHLLEVGLIVTDDAFNEIARTATVIAPPTGASITMEAGAATLHADNGLWNDVRKHGLGRMAAQHELTRWLGAVVGDKRPVMGGSSVHFDRAWLRVHLPALEDLFHYRNLDVSTVKELNTRLGFAPKWNTGRKAHRALPDLEDSLAELRHYLAGLGL